MHPRTTVGNGWLGRIPPVDALDARVTLDHAIVVITGMVGDQVHGDLVFGVNG
jgi:hypothetical protein